MRSLLLCLLAFASTCGVHATGPAASLSVSQHGLDYVKGVVGPIIDNTIKGLKLPEIKDDTGGFTIHLFDIHVDAFDAGTYTLDFDSGKGLKLGISGFSVKVHVHFDAKQDGWPHISTAGTAEVKASHITASADLDLSEKGGKPSLAASSVKVSIGDIKASFSDGLIGDLLNVLQDLFESKLKDAAESAVSSAISSEIGALNKQLSTITLAYPLASWGAEVNFALTSAPTVTSRYAGLDLVGLVQNTKTPSPLPPSVPRPALPGFAASGSHYLQLEVSVLTLESLAWTYQQHGNLKRTVPHTALPAGSPIQLNTTDLAAFAPGLKAKFPNMWCQLLLQAVGVPSATASASGGLAVSYDVDVAVQPITAQGPVTAFVMGCPINGSVSVAVAKGSTLTGHIGSLSCQLKEVNSTVGALNLQGFNSLFNSVILDGIVLPLVNDLLGAGIPLPAVDGVSLTNAGVSFADNAISVAADFKWQPSSAATPTAATPFASMAR